MPKLGTDCAKEELISTTTVVEEFEHLIFQEQTVVIIQKCL